ncbi:GntR family transcriptional regulator [Bordetella pertussis]|uniref:GntR-family transcriptional regulator n=13 Tax=Bordetella TaxID=517 RepID=Q7VT54_BORPE|nr:MULTISPECIES: GntR family transcriptional regulator [Bordetella]ETH40671.1 UbiC transcription regulator-associated domain protein [Bordetella pertussis H918]ETH44412.1 UbiC transcription regulator-associated domain protein [Bordetella pertussis H939]ETH48781.1 UbiC transcription regulator-associated domain protein [Bordetella pertussis H921]ETH73001.1 UbiC transcription regulator-associated domain protein [Bordetella pertussis STO1-CHLA-0011]ETH81287.1 UbiC transcription regulator-associate
MDTDAIRSEIFGQLARPDNSGIPKYRRLSNILVEAIRRGVWQPGDRLPAEEQLTEMTPFSLGTVQRALRALTDEGLVIRMQGHGNFVADQQRQMADPWHCRFLDDESDGIVPIYSKAVQRAVVTPSETGPWQRYLHSGSVMRLDRIINVNDEFRIFSRFYADRELLQPLWHVPLEELDGANFKDIIMRQVGLPITEIDRSVRIRRIDAQAARLIGVAPEATVLFMQAVARAGRDACIYYQEFYIPETGRALQLPEQRPRVHGR